MAGYVFLFRGGALHEDDVSPEEMQQHMQKWHAWVQDMSDRGIYQAGEPLKTSGGRYVASGGVVSDGPFPEAKEMVAGFIHIDVDSLDEATDVAKECPIFEYDGQVEVREIFAEESEATEPIREVAAAS